MARVQAVVLTNVPVVDAPADALPPKVLMRFCRKPSRVGAPAALLLPDGLIAWMSVWKSLCSLLRGLAAVVVLAAVLPAAVLLDPVLLAATVPVLAAVVDAVPVAAAAAVPLALDAVVPVLAPVACVREPIRFCNWLTMEFSPPL